VHMGYRDAGLYRPEAIRHADGPSGGGRPLRLSRGWIDATFYLIVAMVIAALLFCTFGDIGQYARGPAMVRIEGRSSLTAATSGVIAEVHAVPGRSVKAGDVLVRLHDDAERAALDGLELEHRTALSELLRDPSSTSARERIAALSRERELLEARLRERELVAPHDGVVSDVRIRGGQAVAAGEPLLTLAVPGGNATVVALLPGHARPQLQPGMKAHLELDGFARELVELEVESIGDEVIGPAEVARFLGPERADALEVSGPIVVVTAKLPADALVVDGHEYAYFDGMPGRLELRVHSESILTTLVPGLRELVERIP
jgi:hypothetical protein